MTPLLLCPVCHRKVTPTLGDNVYRHLDTVGHNCPMSGKPFVLVTAGAA